MKALITLFAMTFSIAASAATELVILDGYEGYNKYALKSISTVEAPLSTGFLVPIEQAAYCFNGDVNGVVPVIQAMIDAEQVALAVAPGYTIEADTTSVGDPLVVKNLVITNYGEKVAWSFSQLRPCNRVTK